MKRVLVTGATGFIGRHALKPLMHRGFEVHAVRHAKPATLEGVTWYEADLLDESAVVTLMRSLKPSHLLHFAWYALPQDYRESPANLRWCQAGIELLRQFAEHGGRRAVFAGSCFEYDLRWGLCSEELTPSVPATLYGTCKNALRQVALEFSRRAGLSAAWGRIFYLYGPHEAPERLVPAVVRALLRGERAKCTHGRQIRDFLHVEDVADAFAALLDNALEGTVNIGSGEPITVRSLVERIAEIMGRPELVDFGAIAPAPTDPAAVIADARRLSALAGWHPRWPLEDGLAAAVEWWRRSASP
jgi:nucleoside-diphosphate-sugar epimerase